MDFKLGEEEELVQATVRELAQSKFRTRAAEIDSASLFPEKNLEELAELGLLGSILSSEYGGADTSTLTYALILEEIARACASTAVIVSVTTMVGKAIDREGTPEQKQQFLTRIANGDTIGAFCLTEPEAGSDPASMKSTASRDGDLYVLNGQKLWITNAPHSDIFIVMANEDPSLGSRGISAFLVEKSSIVTGEFTIGEPEKKMGLNGSHTCALFIDDVVIPASNRLGEKGRGLSIALKSLDTGRIGISAQALGIAQAAFDDSLRYAKEREQFGRPIGKFQAISFKLADMRMKLEAARLMTYRAAWMADQGTQHTLESSMAKAFSTEAAAEVTQEAIKIHGGMGFSKELPVERYHRDIQATMIYEGTNEIQRVVISRQLGL